MTRPQAPIDAASANAGSTRTLPSVPGARAARCNAGESHPWLPPSLRLPRGRAPHWLITRALTAAQPRPALLVTRALAATRPRPALLVTRALAATRPPPRIAMLTPTDA